MELTTDDRLSIAELCSRACHALDFNDPDGYADLFTSRGVFQRQASAAAGSEIIFRHEGKEELRAFAIKASGMRQGLARHWMANMVIRPTDTGAEASSYTMLVANDAEARSVGILIAGIYRDVLEKTDAGWRFASRTVVDDV